MNARYASVVSVLLALACGREPDRSTGTLVADSAVEELNDSGLVTPAAAPVGSGDSSPTSTDQVLRVVVRGRDVSDDDRVTLPCAAPCTEVEAVVSGGSPPFALVWEDGSTLPRRQLCRPAGDRISVQVRDTASSVGEFYREAQTASKDLGIVTPACADAGSPEGGVASCQLPSVPSCDLGGRASLPEDLAVDLSGAVRYFSRGAALPAGRYRISYADGCNTYGSLLAGAGWTVHVSTALPGVGNCALVGPDGQAFLVAPGTTGTLSAVGDAFASYAACVAANCRVPPIDFEFAGGQLGLLRNGVAFGAIDDVGGEMQGGRSPTFRLQRLDDCPGTSE